jgi:beta-glucanase (GH16 family)
MSKFLLALVFIAGCGGSGTAAAPDGGGDSAPGTGTFQLAWQDDFDSFDGTRWALQTFSWDGNLAQFSTANASVANGIVTIALTPEPTDTVKPFRGVEMRSLDTITYGKVESRIRFAKGSGVVSSLVLIYTPWPADDWNELDIEFLGLYTDRAQTNVMVYTGPPTTPPVTTSVTPTPFAEFVTFDFDPSADFHVYAIEWTPTEARFVVDGVVKRTWSDRIDRLKLPQNILLTIWASSAASWAGPIQSDTAPTTADYDWVKVYDWVPDPAR